MAIRARRAAAAWLGLLLLALSARAAAASAPSGQEDSLDEAIVSASRARLTAMRAEMVRLEDQFYARYNELNGNDEFDMHCARETRTGTRLARRECRPVFETRAIEAEAVEYYWMMLKDPPGSASAPVPAIVTIDVKRPGFRRNMIEVTRQHPELVKLLRERAEAVRKYDATRRRLFGLKPPPDLEVDTAEAPATLPPP
jgi:hypothetical protein